MKNQDSYTILRYGLIDVQVNIHEYSGKETKRYILRVLQTLKKEVIGCQQATFAQVPSVTVDNQRPHLASVQVQHAPSRREAVPKSRRRTSADSCR
jgi:hypothetical protein